MHKQSDIPLVFYVLWWKHVLQFVKTAINPSLTVLSSGSVCYQNAQLLEDHKCAYGNTLKSHHSVDFVRCLKVLCISGADETR